MMPNTVGQSLRKPQQLYVFNGPTAFRNVEQLGVKTEKWGMSNLYMLHDERR